MPVIKIFEAGRQLVRKYWSLPRGLDARAFVYDLIVRQRMVWRRTRWCSARSDRTTCSSTPKSASWQRISANCSTWGTGMTCTPSRLGCVAGCVNLAMHNCFWSAHRAACWTRLHLLADCLMLTSDECIEQFRGSWIVDDWARAGLLLLNSGRLLQSCCTSVTDCWII